MESVQCQGRDPLEVAGRPHVGRNGKHLNAQPRRGSRNLVECGGAPGTERQRGTLAREGDRQRPPQATRRSRDEGHLSVESLRHPIIHRFVTWWRPRAIGPPTEVGLRR